MAHNIIKTIPLDKKYEFVFLEENMKTKHPVSNYFLKINDLSINLLISLKWIRWGFFFLNSISNDLRKQNYPIETLITNAIQKKITVWEEEEHELLIDNNYVKTEEELENLISNFYNIEIFNENTKIHLKLKINLKEYLLISNVLFPTLLILEEIKTF